MRINLSCISKFWNKVNKHGKNGCWVWEAGKRDGYGIFGRNISAHRFSWELIYGPIPRGIHVLHKCNNKACVNPSHLYLGDPVDNMLDCIKAGYKGEKCSGSKLKNKDIPKIKEMVMKGTTQTEVGKMFGVVPSTISSIICGRSWVGI